MEVENLGFVLVAMLLTAAVVCAVAAWCMAAWSDSFVDYHVHGDCRIPDCYECDLEGVSSCPICGCSTPDLRFHENCLLAMFDEIDWEDIQ